ncbi:pyridoxal phosphate-dependent transferase [Hyaloscypha sp. PMI_1271]|nr:pyridoxal phosphate-dependent transferase [Hyaloscypha sp. PMI_1271]
MATTKHRFQAQRVSVDLRHHLNAHSKARHPSPLKDIIKFMGCDGMVSLAGGLPHPSLFPFQSAIIQTYPYDKNLSTPEVEKIGNELLITEDESSQQLLSLSKALQYGSGTGDQSLRGWAREFTNTVFKPACSDFEILLNCGNTDGWNKIVRMLCEPGDFILVEQYTYPSAQALWIPMGCVGVPIKSDGQGMSPEDLDSVLASWEEARPGVKRPHLLYLVPVGSNPTGLTMDGDRREKFMTSASNMVCLENSGALAKIELILNTDIIICEDDPYSFLQFPAYIHGGEAALNPTTPQEYLDSLVPSFLKCDTQGRVIRLDTFSKTLAPGNRLGYFVANPLFTERLLRATEVETQSPSGWSQVIAMSLLGKWGMMGYVEWLSNLRGQYFLRRNWMCDSIALNFTLVPATSRSIPGAAGLVVFSKDDESLTTPLFSFIPPTAGMFIWARFYYSGSSRFRVLQADETCVDPEAVFETEIWAEMAKALVLLTPGSYYEPWQGKEKTTTKSRGGETGIGFFRLAYSLVTKEEMELGMERMAAVLEKVFKGEPNVL